MSMIPLGASSCARKPFYSLLNSGEYLLRPGFFFNLCVCLCYGKYLKVHEKLLFYNLHVVLCYNIYRSNIIHYLFLTHAYHMKISTIFILKYYSDKNKCKNVYSYKNIISYSYTSILSGIYKQV